MRKVTCNKLLDALNQFFKCDDINDEEKKRIEDIWKQCLKDNDLLTEKKKNSIEPTLEQMKMWGEFLCTTDKKEQYNAAKQHNFMIQHCRGCLWNEYGNEWDRHYIDYDSCGKEKYEDIRKWMNFFNGVPPKKMGCYTPY